MLRETKEEKRTPPLPQRLCLDGVLSLREVDLLLLLLLGDERSLVLGESSADSTGLLGPEVERSVPKIVRIRTSIESPGLNALLALVE